MLPALPIGREELNSMNTLLQSKSPFDGSHRPDSARRLELSEKHSLAFMYFFVTTGLTSVVADVFTNTVPMPNGMRDFWAVICVVTFVLSVVGITLFFLSYKTSKPGDRYSKPNRK